MSSDILQEILIEFIEVWLHNVIYRSNLYPSQIFRSRYKYNISVKQSTFPPLNNYIRTLVLSLQPQLRQQAIHSVTVNISLELEIQESFTLTISYPDVIDSQLSDNEPPEKVLSSCKDSFRGHIVSVLNSDSKHDSQPSKKRTFSVSVKTSELAGCQMSGWCGESVAELNVTSVVRPLLFTDVGLVRVQTTHRI